MHKGVNYNNYLTILFMSVSMLLAGTDNTFSNMTKAEAPSEEIKAKEVDSLITVAQYFKLGPDTRAEVVYNLLKQYSEFLLSPMENSQRKLVKVYREDIKKENFVTNYFYPLVNGRRSANIEAIDGLNSLLLAVEEGEPSAPLVNELGYFLDQK